jgi:hypothetical protein
MAEAQQDGETMDNDKAGYWAVIIAMVVLAVPTVVLLAPIWSEVLAK